MRGENPFDRLGRWMDAIESRMSRLFGRGSPGDAAPSKLEPVEIRMQALKQIAGCVQPTGRGGYYFPHAGVKLTLRSSLLAPAFSNPQFEQDLQAELVERSCGAGRVAVTIEIVEGPGQPVEIEYLDASKITSEKDRPDAYVKVLRGKAAVETVRVSGDRIYIGRLAEVRQKDGSILRRNEVAFDESETTVSRKHAWIQYEPGDKRFRVFDDPQSGRGTQVVRNGSTIRSDSVRGVELRDGDEIHLGNAQLRFDVGGRPPESDPQPGKG